MPRPALYAERGEALLHRLIQTYPTHGFVLDREELEDLGLPNRPPDQTEATLLDQLALALIEFGNAADLIEVVEAPHTPETAAQKAIEGMPKRRTITGATKTSRQPSKARESKAR